VVAAGQKHLLMPLSAALTKASPSRRYSLPLILQPTTTELHGIKLSTQQRHKQQQLHSQKRQKYHAVINQTELFNVNFLYTDMQTLAMQTLAN